MAKNLRKCRQISQYGMLAWLAVLAMAGVIVHDPERAVAQTTRPHYDAAGDLKIPKEYETWVFVGSNIGLGYKQSLSEMTAVEAQRVERGSFHNIYINPEAYRHIMKTGAFPDPTILVMEHYVAQDKEPRGIVDKGVFNGSRSGVEVAVKNAQRPDGSTTPWAYYVFTDPDDPSETKPVAKPFPDAACYRCHREHADVDNVWVQFYPVLRKFKR